MLYNRYYNLNSSSNNDFNLLFKSIDVFFVGNSNETRAKKVISLIEDFYKKDILSIEYDIENEKYSIEKLLSGNLFCKRDLSKNGKDLISHFVEDLTDIGINGKNILIDITSIKHPFLFYFLLLLKKNFNPKTLFITYTEPESYEQEKKKI